jgi:hypothetical protein
MRKAISLLLSLSLLPSICFAAIAFDSSDAGGSTGTSDSFSLTTSADSDIYVCVGVFAPSGDDITGVTSDGNNLTRLSYKTSGIIANYLYEITNQSAGSHSIIVSSSNTDSLYHTAMSYTGADTSVVSSNVQNASGNSSTPTIGIVIAGAGSWVIGCTNSDNQNASALSWTYDRGSAGITGSDSNGIRGIGSDSMQWGSSIGNWADVAAEIVVPSSGGSGDSTSTNATSTSSGCNLSVSDIETSTCITYLDWLIMNLWILFCVSFLPIGFFFNLWKQQNNFGKDMSL